MAAQNTVKRSAKLAAAAVATSDQPAATDVRMTACRAHDRSDTASLMLHTAIACSSELTLSLLLCTREVSPIASRNSDREASNTTRGGNRAPSDARVRISRRPDRRSTWWSSNDVGFASRRQKTCVSALLIVKSSWLSSAPPDSM